MRRSLHNRDGIFYGHKVVKAVERGNGVGWGVELGNYGTQKGACTPLHCILVHNRCVVLKAANLFYSFSTFLLFTRVGPSVNGRLPRLMIYFSI